MSTSVLMMPANSQRQRVIMIREKSVVDFRFLSRLFALFELVQLQTSSVARPPLTSPLIPDDLIYWF